MKHFADDMNADAVVEAVVLFPIMIMIFAALVLLAAYLPTRAALQRATQYAATAIATESGDTWLFFDEGSMSYYWETNRSNLDSVYVALFSGRTDVQSMGEDIVTEIERRSVSSTAGVLSVDCYIINKHIYKEAVITAERVFTVPVDLSFIRFPETVSVKVTSTAVVHNGDEFVRNMDMAAEFMKYIKEKLGLSDLSESIRSSKSRVGSFLGW